MEQLLSSIQLIYAESQVPCLLVGAEFGVEWANAAALQAYPALAVTGGLELLLPRTVLNALHAIGSAGAIHLPVMRRTLTLHPVGRWQLLQFLQGAPEKTAHTIDTSRMLIASLSSQVREPLTNIFMGASTVAQVGDLEENERLQQLAKEINQSGYVLLRLTNSVTTYMQYLLEPPVPSLQLVDLCELVGQLCSAAAMLVGASAGIGMEVILPKAPVLVEADPDRLTQVLLQLISNSCRFSRAENCITVIVEQVDEQATITLSDCGLGIPTQLLQRVFEPFFSRGEAGMPYAGIGLGLTLARMLVTSMNGSMVLTAQEGEGTTVAIRLPLAGPNTPLSFRSPALAGEMMRDRFSQLHVILSESCGAPRP